MQSMHLRTSEFAAIVKLLTCMLRSTVACFAGPSASAESPSGSCSTCKTLSEYCGLSKPKSYALHELAVLCWASTKAEPAESTPGIAGSNLYSLFGAPLQSAICCTTNMRRTATAILAFFGDMHVRISRKHIMTTPLWEVDLTAHTFRS